MWVRKPMAPIIQIRRLWTSNTFDQTVDPGCSCCTAKMIMDTTLSFARWLILFRKKWCMELTTWNVIQEDNALGTSITNLQLGQKSAEHFPARVASLPNILLHRCCLSRKVFDSSHALHGVTFGSSIAKTVLNASSKSDDGCWSLATFINSIGPILKESNKVIGQFDVVNPIRNSPGLAYWLLGTSKMVAWYTRSIVLPSPSEGLKDTEEQDLCWSKNCTFPQYLSLVDR